MNWQLVKSVRSGGRTTVHVEGGLMRDRSFAKPPTAWWNRSCGQEKSWIASFVEDLTGLSSHTALGLRGWNGDWVAMLCELAQGRRNSAAAVWDAMKAKLATSATRPW